MTQKKNNNIIKAFDEYSLRDPARFGINFTFKRDIEATYDILLNYNLMCATIVLVSSVNFLIDPKVVPGRAGLMVTIFLVLTNFFNSAQVISNMRQFIDQIKFEVSELISECICRKWQLVVLMH